MDTIVKVFTFINDMGASISMPILMTIIGLAVGLRFRDAIRSGIMYGIGFEGINLIVGYFLDTLSLAADAISSNLGLNLEVLDAGWPLGASMAFSSSLLPLSIVLIVIVNILLIYAGFLKTLNIDIWNYWMIIGLGVLVYTATGLFWLSLAVVVLASIIVAKLSDYFAKYLWDMGNVAEGVSLPHLDTITLAPIYFAVNYVIDRIPVVRDWDISLEKIEDRVGALGDPAIMGAVVGGLLGVVAGFGIQEILKLAIVSGTTMVLFPRVCSLLMEGLAPIAEAIRDLVDERMEGKEVYIGLDAAIGVGDPTVLIVGIIMIPIILVLAAVVPGNRMLPFATLSSAPFYVLWAVAISRKNIFRSIVASTVGFIFILLGGSFVAFIYTKAALVATPDLIPAGSTLVSSISAGNPLYSIVLFILKLFGVNV